MRTMDTGEYKRDREGDRQKNRKLSIVYYTNCSGILSYFKPQHHAIYFCNKPVHMSPSPQPESKIKVEQKKKKLLIWGI